MGKGIVEKLKNDYDIELIHRGFEIHADVPESGMLLTDYFPNADQMFGQLKTMGAPYGLEFNTLTMMPNTNKALQIGEYAKEINKSFEFNSLMYHSTFVDNINISSVTELKNIAHSVGISEEEVNQVLSTDKYKKILATNIQFCRDNNISSVPTFIINDEVVVVGAQGIDRFKDIFDKLANGSVLL